MTANWLVRIAIPTSAIVLAGCGGAEHQSVAADGPEPQVAADAPQLTAVETSLPDTSLSAAVVGFADGAPVTAVLAGAPSSRVRSIVLRGQSLTITVTSARAGVEEFVALWEAKLIGAEIGRSVGVPIAHVYVDVTGPDGAVIASDNDRTSPGGGTYARPDIDAVASALDGATLVSTRSWPNGAAELVISAADPARFIAAGSPGLAALAGPDGDAFAGPDGPTGPYLVRLVDHGGTTIVAWSYIPDFGGGGSWGSAWYAAGVHAPGSLHVPADDVATPGS
jgi:hypothetical protein